MSGAKLTVADVNNIFIKYTENISKHTSDELLKNIGLEYSKSSKLIKLNLLKKIKKQVDLKTISLDAAAIKYKFTREEIDPDSEQDIKIVEVPVPVKDIIEVPIKDNINVNVNVNVNDTLDNILSELKKIREDIKLLNTKEDMIKNTLDLVQQLIKNKNPNQIVENIRAARIETKTEYIEPVRPIVQQKVKVVEIVNSDELHFGVKNCFHVKDIIKQIVGARWEVANKTWIMNKKYLEEFTGLLTKSGHIFVNNIVNNNIPLKESLQQDVGYDSNEDAVIYTNSSSNFGEAL